MKKLINLLGDILGTSEFSKEFKLWKNFIGVEITRKIYEQFPSEFMFRNAPITNDHNLFIQFELGFMTGNYKHSEEDVYNYTYDHLRGPEDWKKGVSNEAVNKYLILIKQMKEIGLKRECKFLPVPVYEV